MHVKTRHPEGNRYRGVSARRRLFVAAIPGIIVGSAGILLKYPFFALLSGWETLAIIYLASLWLHIGQSDAAETAHHATTEDPTIAISDTLLILASVASLGAVLSVLILHISNTGWIHAIQLCSVVLGLALSWLIIHSVFTLRYARLYYRGTKGGINFHQNDPPRYSDFAYMAFTIGMTFQVSDTDIGDSSIRRTVILHSLLSYLFGTVILATAINLLVTLSR